MTETAATAPSGTFVPKDSDDWEPLIKVEKPNYGFLKVTITKNSDGSVVSEQTLPLTKRGLTRIHGPYFNNATVCELKRSGRVEYRSEVNDFTIVYELQR